MAKGSIAKLNLVKLFADKLPDNYLGEFGGKYYFQAPEDGGMVQIAISMTCPKTPVTANKTVVIPNKGGGMDFENAETVATPVKKSEISDEEKDTIAKLMKELGL